jgi:hypothetical protein
MAQNDGRLTNMRIELESPNGYSYRIDTENWYIASAWFAEHAPILMSLNSQSIPRLRIYPTTPEERSIMGASMMGAIDTITSDNIQGFIEKLQSYADRLKAREEYYSK